MGIDPTFPPPARRTLQKSATIVLIRKSLLDPMPPASCTTASTTASAVRPASRWRATRRAPSAAAASRIHALRLRPLPRAAEGVRHERRARSPAALADPDALAVSSIAAATASPRSLGACEIAGTNRRGNGARGGGVREGVGPAAVRARRAAPDAGGHALLGRLQQRWRRVAADVAAPRGRNGRAAVCGQLQLRRPHLPAGARGPHSRISSTCSRTKYPTHTPGCAFVDLVTVRLLAR